MEPETDSSQTLRVTRDDGTERHPMEEAGSINGAPPKPERADTRQGGLTRFGRYEVVEEIGRGAMGVVFKAWDPKLDRWVALKTVQLASSLSPSEKAEFLHRFAHEARAAGRLSHPHIVTIYDVVEEAEVPFIAMEYIQGRTLESILHAEDRLTWEKAAEVAAQIAEALEHAHARGIVHRDIKPANILLTPEGQAKVTDFGIAKITASTATQGRQLWGTPSYMSPEQILGRALDGRSDIFSLGIILYNLLAGTSPFQGEDTVAICYQIVHHEPPLLRVVRPDLPADFGPIVAKALAKDRDHRYQRAGEIQGDLQRLLRGVASELPSPVADRTVEAGPLPSSGDALKQVWDTLSVKGRALVARGRDLWERRHEMRPRHLAVLSVAAGLVVLSLVLLLLHWTDPLNRAKRDLKAGRTEAAIAALLDLKARRPGSAEVDYVLGEAYLQAGRNGPAVKAYRRAMELKPAYAKDTALLRRLVGLLGSSEAGGEVSKLMIEAGDPAEPVLDEALDSRLHRVRWNAVRTLEQMGKRPDYVRPYILDLQYEDCFARKRAADRLGEIGDRRAIPALQEAKRRRLVDNYCMLGALDRALGRLGAR